MKLNTDVIIDHKSKLPIYKQIIQSIQFQISNGTLMSGDDLPSMNVLSELLSVSKETIKKSYAILRDNGVIESIHGKGFYVKNDSNGKIRVLMLFDKLSTYKLVLYRSFAEYVGDNVEINIHLHNQDINLFESLMEEHAGNYDYHVITPHFPTDSATQSKVRKLLQKIPNRKLIILDRNLEDYHGNYGAVYQDFENDPYKALSREKDRIKKYKDIHVFSPGSLYGYLTKKGVQRFCIENGIKYYTHKTMSEQDIIPGSLYIILNSQLDDEVINFIQSISVKKMKIGKDIGIISYNDSPINEIILNGLTALSTDFKEMGRLAAEMVITGKLKKIKNKFGLIVRKSI